jgi:hypothetical protein
VLVRGRTPGLLLALLHRLSLRADPDLTSQITVEFGGFSIRHASSLPEFLGWRDAAVTESERCLRRHGQRLGAFPARTSRLQEGVWIGTQPSKQSVAGHPHAKGCTRSTHEAPFNGHQARACCKACISDRLRQREDCSLSTWAALVELCTPAYTQKLWLPAWPVQNLRMWPAMRSQ